MAHGVQRVDRAESGGDQRFWFSFSFWFSSVLPLSVIVFGVCQTLPDQVDILLGRDNASL
jgi:hypothetical protein